METISVVGRHMPLVASVPVTLLYIIVMLLLLRNESSKALRFAVLAIGARMCISIFAVYTFAKSPLGLSYNGLATLFMFGVGLLVIRKRPILAPGLLPIYVLMLLIVISGFMNNELSDMVAVIAKYGYFAVVMLSIVDALEDVGSERVMRMLLAVLSIQLVMQIIALPLGVTKAGESDGSASYIGGFNHEAAFSVGVGAALLTVCFARGFRPGLKVMLILGCSLSILLANYRTSVLALAPLILITFLTGVPRYFVPRQRGFVTAIMVIAALATVGAGAWLGKDRYSDISTVSADGTDIIKPPNTFSVADRKLLSGRALIWSRYIYAYRDGTPVQHLVGFGAESWQGKFKLYAHNTLISTLYELGIFGVVSMIFLWGSMLFLAIRAPQGPRLRLIVGHLSFIILGLATMPMWMLEGLILYAILCGYTIYCAGNKRGNAIEPVAQPQTVFPSSQPATMIGAL